MSTLPGLSSHSAGQPQSVSSALRTSAKVTAVMTALFRPQSLVLAAALVLGTVASIPAWAGSPASVAPQQAGAPKASEKTAREKLTLLLSGYHGLPGRAQLEAAIPEVRVQLEALARDPKAFLLHRQRALVALGAWADEGVFALYTEVLKEQQPDEDLVHRVLPAACQAFGERAMPLVERFLASRELDLRHTAIDALGQVDTPASLARLERALKQERDPALRQAIAKAMEHVR